MGHAAAEKVQKTILERTGRWITQFIDLYRVPESPYLNNQSASATLFGHRRVWLYPTLRNRLVLRDTGL